MELRISSGIYKNKKIKVPDSARPVRDRIKLAVFSILEDKVLNANCLDLFAGSGNLGIEALSRGAFSCIFVDNDYFAIKSIKENIENLNLNIESTENVAKPIKDEAIKFLSSYEKTFDIIFIDAPYELPIKHVFKVISEVMTNTTTVIYFHSHKSKIDIQAENKFLKIYDSRKYGITQVDFIKLSLLDG